MVMWTVIIKNNGVIDQTIEDLGTIVPSASQIDFSDQFTYDEIAGSDDLRSLITAANLIVNDGSTDLDVTDGVNWLTIDNLKDVSDNIDDVRGRISAHIVSAGIHGENDATTDDIDDLRGRIRTHGVSGTVHFLESSIDIGNIGVSAHGHPTYAHVVDLDSEIDDVRGRIATHEVSAGVHFLESSIDHLNIQNIGTTTHVVLDDRVLDLEQHIVSAAAHGAGNTLDDAYNEGGPGAGRLITASAGPVEIDRSTSTDASFRIVPKGSLPTTNLADGQLDIKDGIFCIYDNTRSKWLSIERSMLVFGRAGKSKDQYLPFYVGSLPSNNSGLRMMRNATIVGISGQLDNSGTCNFRIRKNDVTTDIVTLTLASVIGDQDATLNIDVSQGDYLQSYIENANKVDDPVVMVEIAWRL